MKSKLEQIYRELQALELRAKEAFAGINSEVTQTGTPELIDSGFLCREIASMTDSIRKGAEAKQAILGRTIAAKAAIASMQGGTIELKGELATASPDVDVKPKLPNTGTPEYEQLMKWIGVSDELLASDMLRPSWSTIARIIKERAISGQKPPPGILITYTDAMVIFRRRTKR